MALKLRSLNESAEVEWDSSAARFRARYHSSLYGWCVVSFQIESTESRRPLMAEDSFLSEELSPTHEAKTHSLTRAAQNFLKLKLLQEADQFSTLMTRPAARPAGLYQILSRFAAGFLTLIIPHSRS